jgi:hypothetical protein
LSPFVALDTFRSVLRKGESMQSMKSKLLYRGVDGVIGFSVADELQSEDDGATDTLDDGFGIDNGSTDGFRNNPEKGTGETVLHLRRLLRGLGDD